MSVVFIESDIESQRSSLLNCPFKINYYFLSDNVSSAIPLLSTIIRLQLFISREYDNFATSVDYIDLVGNKIIPRVYREPRYDFRSRTVEELHWSFQNLFGNAGCSGTIFM